MYSVNFKTGSIVLRAVTPEKLDLTEPYSLFVCDDGEADFTAEFSYVSEISIYGSAVMKSSSFDVYEDEAFTYFYYHPTGSDEYYAVRKTEKNENCRCFVYIPEKFRGKIWTRLVFSLIGFDELASQLGAAVFHASVVEYCGEALLFTAPCGMGKSTQAQLWEKYKKAEIINGDKALIYKKDGGFFVSGLPFSGSSGICKNRILPVRAIIRLGQAKENILCEIGGLSAYKAVYEGCYHSLVNSENEEEISSLAADFAANVPVYSLDCLPDKSAVEVLFNKIFT